MFNDILRQLLTGYLEEQFAGRPDLLEKVLPTYPPGAKRLLRDNGVWATALKRDNVQLVTESHPRDHADRCRDRRRRHPRRRRHHLRHRLPGVEVPHADDRDRPRRRSTCTSTGKATPAAYLGVTVPGFPNLFCLYGPNTNIVINGSIIYFSECGVRYILGCLGLLLEGRHRALDVRKDVHDDFNEQVDAENARMAWGYSDVNSWYKNEHGHVAQNWPFTLLEYWQRTLAPDPGEYELID